MDRKERLTHPRMNGIKSGFWSPVNKEELVQRLAEYEDTGLSPRQVKDLMQAYTEVIEKLCLDSVWISVKDALPETDDHVLCCTQNKKGVQTVVRGFYMDGWHCGMNTNVTHWMPLPEPPKEG